MTKIAIVTPIFNSPSTLVQETFDSILSQRENSEFSLTYVVCDGSPDSNIKELVEQRYRKLFEEKGIHFLYVFEADKGMYDALAKGFEKCGVDHNIFAYINAGDYYSPYALSLISRIFTEQAIDWLTGANARYTETGYLSTCDLPVIYPRWLIQRGVFGRFLPAIQQESTFWSGELHRKLDLEKLSKYQYAGDFFMWKTFSGHAKLNIVCAWLSGFRVHHGQITQTSAKAYRQEFKQIATRLGLLTLFCACILRVSWHLPVRLKLLINQNIILV